MKLFKTSRWIAHGRIVPWVPVVLLILFNSVFIAAALGQGNAGSKGGSSGNESIELPCGIRFVEISPGHFQFGSQEGDKDRQDIEFLQVDCQVERGFFMQVTEVSNDAFAQFVAETGYETLREQENNRKNLKVETWRDGLRDWGADAPVTQVGLADALEFCKWLTRTQLAEEVRQYRLPTEREWEYCCRAGTNTLFTFGDDYSKLEQFGWVGRRDYLDPDREYEKDEIGVVREGPRPCASLLPNAWGLYDMHGNVKEIVDSFHKAPGECIRPSDVFRTDRGPYIVVRGGSWTEGPDFARCAARSWIGPTVAWYRNTGFRVVADTNIP